MLNLQDNCCTLLWKPPIEDEEIQEVPPPAASEHVLEAEMVQLTRLSIIISDHFLHYMGSEGHTSQNHLS